MSTDRGMDKEVVAYTHTHTHTHTHTQWNITQPHKRMPPAETQMDLEIIILSEVG